MFLIDREEQDEFIQLNLTIARDQLTPDMLSRVIRSVRDELYRNVKEMEVEDA